MYKIKIKIDKTGCPTKSLDSLAFTGGSDSIANSLKPGDDSALGSDNVKEITKTFTRAELITVKHGQSHNIESTLTFDTSTTIKASFKVKRAAAELKGKAKGGNRIYYKGDSIPFDV